MNKLRVLELFGGIGACTKALKRLNIDFEVVDYVELDKYAVMSYNVINDTNFEPQDITKWNKDINVDLIMHGSPCQDFSLAGLQAGGDKDSGTRSSLMYETIRIVEKLKPKYVIWENVKNLLSKKHIHNFNAYLEIMESLGYNSYYQVLNAKDYGIPQNRERVFTISIRADIDNGYTFPERKELVLKLKDMLEDNVDEKYYLSDKAINGRLTTNYQKYKLEENIINDKDIHPTILARYEGAPTLYINNATKKGFIEANEGDGIDLTQPNSNTRRGRVQKELCQTITTQNNLGVVIKKDTENYIECEEKGKLDIDCRAFKEDKISGSIMTTPKNKVLLKEKLCTDLVEQGIVKEGDVVNHSYTTSRTKDFHIENSKNNNICATLTTRPDTLGVTVKQLDDLRIRKLTPKECWRLMGFDDKDFNKASKVNSNSQLYKQAGNSIVVNVLEEIIESLLKGSE